MELFFNHTQQLYIKNVLEKTYRIVNSTPSQLKPTLKPITEKRIDNNRDIDHKSNDNDVIDGNGAGQYPIFNRYPLDAVVVKQNQYVRKMTNEKNQKEHKQLVQALQKEYEDIGNQQIQNALQHQILDYSHKQKVSKLQFEEEKYAQNKKVMAEEVAKQRLNSIRKMQMSIKQLLEQQNSMKQLAINDIDNNLHHHNKIAKIDHGRIENEAKINKLEAETRNKMMELQLHQNAEAQKLEMQRFSKQFENEEKMKHDMLEQNLKTKESASKLKSLQQQYRLQQMSSIQTDFDTKQSIKYKMKLQALMSDMQNGEIAKEQKLSDVLDEQMSITSNMLNKQKRMETILNSQEELETNIMTSEYAKFEENIKQKQQEMLEEHKKALFNKLKMQENKLNELSTKQRLKEFECVISKRKQELNDDLSKQNHDLEGTLDLIQKQIQDLHFKETELKLREKEMLEENAFSKIAKCAQTQIANDERQKYASMREEMLKEMQKKEERLTRRHDDIMAKLMKERETQLVTIGKTCKTEVYNETIPTLEKAYESKKEELNRLKQNFQSQEHEIRKRILKMKGNDD